MTEPSRALLFRLGAALAIADYFPLGESTMTNPNVQTLRVNHSVALRNAGNAALAKQVARCEDCGGYGRIMEDHPLNDLTAPTYRDCPRCARKALIVSEVNALLAKGVPLSFALSTVQCIENAAARGEDLEYGPFFNVERVWEMRVEAGE